MPKILLVSHWDWVLYNYWLPVAGALRDLGCEVTFIFPFGAYTERLRDAGYGCINWPVKRHGLNPIQEALALTRLTRIYRRIRPDAVHHITIKPNLYGTIAARVAKVTSVINIFNGLGYLFSTDLQARWLRSLLLPVLRRALDTPSAMTVFESRPDREALVRPHIVAEERTVIISGTAVDTRVFRPRHNKGPGQDPSRPIALLASRLLRDKGINEFVEAARRLRRSSRDWRFWIAGVPDTGSPNGVQEEELIQWQREGTIEFVGHRDDMPELLRQVDVAVLPTYYNEGLPRFLLEAAATGLPLVATDIEACRLVVREGVNGLLVSPRDVDALTDAMRRLLTEEGLRQRLGSASRPIVVENFSEEKVVQQYLRLYRHMGIVPDGV